MACHIPKPTNHQTTEKNRVEEEQEELYLFFFPCSLCNRRNFINVIISQLSSYLVADYKLVSYSPFKSQRTREIVFHCPKMTSSLKQIEHLIRFTYKRTLSCLFFTELQLHSVSPKHL